MNASFAQAGTSSEKASAQWGWVLLAILVCLAAISQQSLWNDEALTAIKAMQPTLGGWWQEMVADKASDMQMPLYMIYMWGFAKIFGVSEWVLRAANLPWFVAGFAAFMGALSGRGKKSLALVALVSPFAWYYLGEARPYAMQLGASLMIFAALYRFSEEGAVDKSLSWLTWRFPSPQPSPPMGAREQKQGVSPTGIVSKEMWWVAVFCFGIISLSGSSLLGMIWAGAACLAAPLLWSWKRLGRLARAHLLIWLPTLGLMAGLSVYYLWTLKQGARASDVGKTDARNIFFIAYELLGFGGLGPGRLEIRDGGVAAFVPFAKSLVIYGVVIGGLLILGIWRVYHTQARARLAGLVVIIALPMVMILGTGYIKEFRVLGRHFTPLLPVILFILWVGLQERWARPHWMSKPLALCFVIFSLASCLSFRFALRHERDDYRGAAGFANAALQAGQMVWWNAGREGAIYYQVPLADQPGKTGRALWLMNPAPEMLPALPPPELIITSKSDVYDGRRAFARYLGQGDYFKFATMPAFTVWQSKGGLAPSPLPRMTSKFD